MSNVLKMLSRGGAAAAETDPNFKQTVLLLHGDETNGAQNNTFLDSSTNNFTITRNGNTTQGTFSPFSVGAGEWSNYFDGSGDYLQTPSNTAFAFGTGDFTVEAWVYVAGTNWSEVYTTAFGSFPSTAMRLLVTNTQKLQFYDGTNTATSSASVSLNSWNHVAVSRSGTTVRLFINGSQDGSTTSSNNLTNQVGYIGRTWDGFSFLGNISNLRVVKGTAVYTSNFTPPTTPLTAITNTSLLTCQSNRFVDNSTNAFAITRNGDVRVTPFSPFAPTAAYSAGTNGGSGYFDGSGDYLSFASNAAFAAPGDFTFECWVYTSSTSQMCIYLVNATNGLIIYTVSNKVVIRSFAVADLVTSSINLPLNQWVHLAAVRSGTTLSLFINGSRSNGGTATNSTSFAQGSLVVGTNEINSIPFSGYIAGLRFVKGTAVYDPTQTTLTVPTSPLTAITNTSLLLNFTNAGIFDNTGKNVLETVGNAQIDTAVKKFGDGSLEFDGTGDWLLMPNTPDQQLGTGNFTIEFWVYLASGDTGSNRGLVAKGTSTTGFLVSLNTTEKVVFTYTTSTITSTGSITTNAWNHIVVVREGTGSNQTKIYINGTNDGTGTVSTDFNQTSVMYVGANRTGGDAMKGFIDDLRITKGVARYTANFTAPTKEFPDQ